MGKNSIMDMFNSSVDVNRTIEGLNLKGAKKAVKELVDLNETILQTVEHEKVQIENEAIEKLGGVANFIDNSVSKKLEDSGEELNRKLIGNHEKMISKVDEKLGTAFNAVDAQVKFHLDSTLKEVNKQAENIKAVADLITNPPGKSFLKSKTLWMNVLMVAGAFITKKTGFEIPTEVFGLALTGVNIALRSITKSPIKWSK